MMPDLLVHEQQCSDKLFPSFNTSSINRDWTLEAHEARTHHVCHLSISVSSELVRMI